MRRWQFSAKISRMPSARFVAPISISSLWSRSGFPPKKAYALGGRLIEPEKYRIAAGKLRFVADAVSVRPFQKKLRPHSPGE